MSGRRDSNPRHPAWKIGSHDSTWSVIAHYCSVKRLSVVRHCLILFDIAKYGLLPKRLPKVLPKKNYVKWFREKDFIYFTNWTNDWMLC